MQHRGMHAAYRQQAEICPAVALPHDENRDPRIAGPVPIVSIATDAQAIGRCPRHPRRHCPAECLHRGLHDAVFQMCEVAPPSAPARRRRTDC